MIPIGSSLEEDLLTDINVSAGAGLTKLFHKSKITDKPQLP